MNEKDASSGSPHTPPMSSLGGVVGDLIRSGTLAQPANPGLAASLGGFGILKQLDEGASSLVFLALRLGTNERVAVKLLRPALVRRRDLVDRFIHSARTTKERLEHPHIARVLEVHDRPEGPYLVMPFYEDGSLAGRLQSGKPLLAGETLSVASDIAAALRHIHEQGLIHRDVKPGNILLDAAGRALLADFGLARTLFNDPVLDAGGQGEGTAPYMSPAVAAGKAEDTRCDIYAFGAVLYHLLTGRPPYTGKTTDEVRLKILADPPEPVTKSNPKASPGLVAICEGAMARQVRDRYSSMEDVLNDLRSVKAGREPHGPHGLHFQWRRLKPIAAGALLAALLGSAGWFFWPQKWDLVPVHRLTEIGITHWEEARLGHWKGHKKPELCTVQDDTLRVYAFNPAPGLDTRVARGSRSRPAVGLTVQSLTNRRLGTSQPVTTRLVGFANVAGDTNEGGMPPDEILVTSVEQDVVVLAAYGPYETPVRQYQLRGTLFTNRVTTNRECTSILGESIRLTRLQGDESCQLLVDVATGWGLNPRGLVCFDVRSSDLLWTNWIAGIPAGIEVLDLDGDGQLEVLLGSYSVSNTNQLTDGTTDLKCSLRALDDHGQTKWTRELGSEYTWCRPLAVRSDQQAEPQPYAWLSAEETVRGSPLLFPSEITNLPALTRSLTDRGHPLSGYLRDRFSQTVQRQLGWKTRPHTQSAAFRALLAQELNRVLSDHSMYDPRRFEGISLSEETRLELARGPSGAARLRFNRLLIEDAYPNAIRKLEHRCLQRRGPDGQTVDELPMKPGVGVVVRLDAQGDALATYDAGASLLSCLPVDLDGDGAEELLATDCWGHLHVLDANLSLRAKRLITTNAYTRVDLRLVALTNLFGAGERHLVLSSSQSELVHGVDPGNSNLRRTTYAHYHNEIIVLDRQLRTLVRREVAAAWTEGYGLNWLRAADVDGDGAAELLVLTDAVTVFRLCRNGAGSH